MKINAQDPVQITVPRWVAQDIAKQAQSPKITPDNTGNNAERVITLRGKDRQDLERVFQTTIESPAQLIDKVKRLCTVKIGEVERTFTHDELARIDMQAQFHGKNREQFLLFMLDEIVGRMLEMV
jgi:hypothetical protein